MTDRPAKLQPPHSTIAVGQDGWLIKRIQTPPGKLELALTAFGFIASITIALSSGAHELFRLLAVLAIPAELALLVRLPFCGIRLLADQLVIVTPRRKRALRFEEVEEARLVKSGPLGEGKEIVIAHRDGEAVRTGVEEGAASIDVRAAVKLINARLGH